jgi:hypothetical protein
MQEGGRVMTCTTLVQLTDDPELTAGEYLQLSVADTRWRIISPDLDGRSGPPAPPDHQVQAAIEPPAAATG